MIHLTKNDYKEISEAVIETILNGSSLDEIEAAGLIFSLDADISEESETAYTGVEFMGDRETYTFNAYTIKDIVLLAVYDNKGQQVITDFDLSSLDLNFSDDYASIAA